MARVVVGGDAAGWLPGTGAVVSCRVVSCLVVSGRVEWCD
jgi:hypothetical protein